MDAFLQTLHDLVVEHRLLVCAILALVTLLEALLLVGVLIPIMAVMLTAGALIATGSLHPVEVVVWCSIGAAAGDAISYLIGQRIGAKAVRHPAVAKHRRTVARARLYTRRYGVLALLVARYLGPLRPFVPMAAGMSRMRDWTFHAANTVTAPLWVVSVLAPGYLAARNLGYWKPDPQWLTALAVGGLLLVATVAVVRAAPFKVQPSKA
ncbi:DedA family protein [Caulobacter hibisci]|uniref:DedA family protein n=1 Tax=Caulobacter hibisci TaxID=2035993 RepID=A0ABS0SXW8_9CAUL|nr:DedA family protein [Caulobacter hibisci]MBI1683533.1 DedA family protein [Caulobacter hibisci]